MSTNRALTLGEEFVAKHGGAIAFVKGSPVTIGAPAKEEGKVAVVHKGTEPIINRIREYFISEIDVPMPTV